MTALSKRQELTFDEVNAAALQRGLPLLEQLLPGGRLLGREYTSASLQGGKGNSCKVNIETGPWADFATGQQGGDLVSLLAAIRGCSQGEALRELAQLLGLMKGTSPEKHLPNPSPQSSSGAKDWFPIVPVPADAPPFRPAKQAHGGTLSKFWVYRNIGGDLVGYIVRYDQADGGKEVIPYTYCRSKSGQKSWRSKAFPEPRSLYNLDKLAHLKPEAGVLLVEGEKTADAATRLRDPGKISMTWPGGSKAVAKADFSPLKDRPVGIWPDADKPGYEAALKLAQVLIEVGANSVSVIVPPCEAPKGWDLADAEAEGWTPGQVADWIRDNRTTPEQFQQIAKERFKIKPMLDKNTAGTESTDAAKQESAEAESLSPQMTAALSVIDKIGRENLINAKGYFWRWNVKGVWRRIEDTEICQVIQEECRTDPMLTGNFVRNTMNLIQNELYRPEHLFDSDQSTINCLNGELHWTGSSWELGPHRPENYRTTQIPVVYDPAAKAPRFERFVFEVFERDADRDDKSVLLLEAVGYSLLSTCRYEKFVLTIGPGANGKSVLLSLLRALAGTLNVCAVQPNQFDNRFQRAHLQGKLINIVTELAEGAEIADAQLKSIVSGELTTAEHKLKPPFDFTPICTCWFGTNHMPHTRDFSAALFRRAIIIPFNRVFKEEEQDKRLTDKLCEELPGILNLALEAIAGVLERGHFTQTASGEAAKADWRLEADQVAQFVEEKCTVDPTRKELSAEFYRHYKAWADEAGIKRTLNRKNFTDRLRKLGAEIVKGTNGIRMLAGFRLAHPTGVQSGVSGVSGACFEMLSEDDDPVASHWGLLS